MKGMALQVRGKENVFLLSLVAHADGYRMMLGAYNHPIPADVGNKAQ